MKRVLILSIALFAVFSIATAQVTLLSPLPGADGTPGTGNETTFAIYVPLIHLQSMYPSFLILLLDLPGCWLSL